MNEMVRNAAGTASAPDVIREYMAVFDEVLRGIDHADIATCADILRKARDSGAMIYVAGNGGSASTATHLANDLGKATKASGMPPMRVVSMSDNVSWLTALGNDEGYDRVFAGQMENFAKAGDVLIVISTSGNSGNLVRAVELAKEVGVTSIGILGFKGGKLKEMVDASVWLPSPVGAYGPVETAHSLVVDLIKECLMADRPAGSPKA
jgi:D-sedoheptulose 7-phosphate isomerase